MKTDRCPLCGNTVFLTREEDSARLCAGPLGCLATLDAEPVARKLKPAA